MTSTKPTTGAALAAAAILSLTVVGSAAAMPADHLAGAANAPVVEQARWICGPRGCVWRGGPRFRGRRMYNFRGPRFHGPRFPHFRGRAWRRRF